MDLITTDRSITPQDYAPNLYSPPQVAQREGDNWGVDIFNDGVNGFYSYDARFQRLLRSVGNESFTNLFEERKNNKLPVHVLDLMGGAYFLRPNQYSLVDSVTGVRLGNPEAGFIASCEEELEFDKKRNNGQPTEYTDLLRTRMGWIQQLNSEGKRQVLYGSVYDKQTWDQLSASMTARDIESFDIVICRPQGPFFENYLTGGEKLTHYQKLKYGLVFDLTFREVLSRVNRENGMMFFQVPEMFDKDWVQKWINRTEKKYGLVIELLEDEEYNEKFDSKSMQFLARYSSEDNVEVRNEQQS